MGGELSKDFQKDFQRTFKGLSKDFQRTFQRTFQRSFSLSRTHNRAHKPIHKRTQKVPQGTRSSKMQNLLNDLTRTDVWSIHNPQIKKLCALLCFRSEILKTIVLLCFRPPKKSRCCKNIEYIIILFVFCSKRCKKFVSLCENRKT